MSYSFTERKRIRKDFGNQQAVLDVPFLLQTQIRSYEEFLQTDVDEENRRDGVSTVPFSPFFRSRPTPATRPWSTSATSWVPRRSM